MNALQELIGTEHDLDHVCRTLKDCVRKLNAPVVGALHVTCSDEAELECIDAFRRKFVDEMLPNLKFWSKAPFHTSNLGGRHEWGAVAIAEQHYAAHETEASFKCLVIKINAHVAVKDAPSGPRYGLMDRYRCESNACGALHAMLEGGHQPFVAALRDAFSSEHLDRAAILRDPKQVDPNLRSLFAAVASARLQARNAMLEIQDHRPTTPTLFIVMPCVTMNRPAYDTEFVCGFYEADARTNELVARYHGLGDDPSRYKYRHVGNLANIEDDQVQTPRPVRDHRTLVHKAWQRIESPAVPNDHRIDEVARDVALAKHEDHPYAKAMANILLATLMEIAPIPAAMVLFAEGTLGLYHAHRIHKLAAGGGDENEARRILRDLPAALEQLPPQKTRRIIEKLLAVYKQ